MPRIRPEGGVVGLNNTPTLATATGMWTMQDVARNLRNSTWPLDAGAADPYFNLNALLIHADSTNGKTNQTYIDSSTGARTITTFGAPYQGTFTPFSQTGWSNYFDGSSSFAFASNAAFGFGTGDFTIETWVYLISNGVSGGTNILDFRATATAIPFTVYIKNTGSGNYVGSYTSAGATGVEAQSGLIALHQWTHIAITRTSGTWRIFINGVSQTLTGSGYNGDLGSSKPLTVGATVGGGSPLTSYISNLRIVKGTSLYTANFNPSTIELTAVSGTSLLTCQSNRFRDNSVNGFSATITGAPVVEAFEPFPPIAEYSTFSVGGSIYFDGSDDYLTVPGNADLTFNADFTIECFCYVPSSLVGGTILAIGNEATGRLIISFNSSRQLQIDIFNVATVPFTGGTFNLNTWNHFAWVRIGSTITAYINGTSVGTYTNSSTLGNTSSVRIARDNGANHTKAFLSGLNIVKGTALYVSSFTPPTAPITAHADTKLLLSGTNAGIIDQTAKNNLTTFASAVVATAQSKFGGSSMYFNGATGTYVYAVPNIDFAFGNGNFTVESWIYFDSTAGTFNPICQSDVVGSSTNDKWFLAHGSNTLRFATHASGGFSVTIPWTPTTGVWYHVAAVRSSGVMYLFINGILGISTVTGTPSGYSLGQNGVSIGGMSSPYYLNGYLDDLRITKGFARYTALFTPPASPFSNR
jgi:hypothetical protein